MPDTLTMVLANQRSELERLTQAIEQFGASNALKQDDVVEIELLLDEIVTNVMRHGYEDSGEHEIHLSMTLGDEAITIEVMDEGRPFNLLDQPPPNLDLPIEQRPIGGLGIFLVKSLVTRIDYRRDGGRNVVTMTKALRGR